YGDIATKSTNIPPVFARISNNHRRVSNDARMKGDISDCAGDRQYVVHLTEMRTHSIVGVINSAKPGAFICFTLELLGPRAFCAREFKNAAGDLVEESDRWQQALVYCDIARGCWDEAIRRSKQT